MKNLQPLKSLQIIPLLLPFAFLATQPAGASIVLLEDFETDGEGTRYTSTGSFTDGTDDYFIRTDGSSGASGIPAYSNYGGTYFWAAEDIDATENATGLALLDFTDIDLGGFNAVTISLDIGAGSMTTFDSADDFVLVQYRVDAGAWQNALAFQNDGSTFNSALYQDTDFDGIGDGVMLEFSLQTITSASLPVSGSFMDLRIDTLMTGGGEAVAFDNIQVTAVPEPATAGLAMAAGVLLMLLRKRFLPRRENESRA